MKRMLSILLALVMLLTLATGCAPSGPTATNPRGEVGKDELKKGSTIVIGIQEDTKVEDYETNAYITWLEETTGYNIEIKLFASSGADAATQLSTQLLNENANLPDILLGFTGVNNTAWRMYGMDGYFVPLSDYFADKDGVAKVWYDRMAACGASDSYVQQILTACSAGDGEIYAFPTLQFGTLDNQNYQVSINKTWLEELNLEMPHDADSLYEVLKAFKAAYPNCHPLVGGKTSDRYGDVVSWLLNMFVYTDDSKYFNVSEDGKTLSLDTFTSDAYREGLKYCAKLYSEGLLSMMSRSEIKALVNVADADTRVGCFAGHPSLVYESGNSCIYNYTACPIWGYAIANDNSHVYQTYVTEAAQKHDLVDECWDLLMTMCSEESSYRQRYGVLGKDWDWADEGTKSITGQDAVINVLNEKAFTSVNNDCLHAVYATILNNCENEGTQLRDDLSEWDRYKYSLQADQWKSFYEAAEKNPQYRYPIITLTDDERDELADITQNCKTCIDQYQLGFINGTYDPNSNADWEAFQKELKKNGIDTWVSRYNEIYTERYYNMVVGG